MIFDLREKLIQNVFYEAFARSRQTESVWDRLGLCKVGGMETAESQRMIRLDRRS